jgi:tetratricopeptide (TPR) repeat protein
MPEPHRKSLLDIGVALAIGGDYARALDTLDEALIRGGSPSAVYVKAMVLFHLGRPQAVVELLEEAPVAALVAAERVRCEYLLRECTVRLGRHRVALSEEALSAKFAAGLDAGYGGRLNEALTLFSDYLIGNPENHLAWNNKAHVLMELGVLEHALVCAVMSITIERRTGIGWCTLGEIFTRLGCSRQALTCFENSFLFDPDWATPEHLGVQLHALARARAVS